jgi:Tfp pilus assembly protein PilV
MNKKVLNSKGQGLIEVIFSIGLIILVMTGVVTLLIKTVGSRSKTYDRNKAIELSQIVMEEIINTEVSDKTNFWNIGSAYWSGLAITQVNPNFPDYTYNVGVAQYSNNGCSAAVTNCLNVTVHIGWRNEPDLDRFNRFFSNK